MLWLESLEVACLEPLELFPKLDNMPFYDLITEEQARLLSSAKLFFVASADPSLRWDEGGPVNLSPKGDCELTVLSSKKVAYLDYNGSGNETARHIRSGGPVVIMVCSFDEKDAAIVRLYGTGKIIPLAESELARTMADRPARKGRLKPRQVIEVELSKTSTTCGYSVPVMSFVRERRKEDRGRGYKTDTRKFGAQV